MPDFDPYAAAGIAPPQAAAAPVQAAPQQAFDPYAAAGVAPPPQAAVAQPQAAPAPDYPIIKPSGDMMADAGHFAVTAGEKAIAGLESLPHTALQGVDYLAGKLKGVLPAEPGDDQTLVHSIADIPVGGGKTLLPGYPEAYTELAKASGGEYQPQTAAGRMAMGAATAALMAPNPETLPGALAGGALSTGAAEAFPNHPLVAALAGGLTGAAAGQKAAQLVASPMTAATTAVNPELAATLQKAQQMGVNIPAYSVPGTPGAIRAGMDQLSELPFSGGAAAREANQVAWQKKLASLMGSNSERITSETVDQAKDRIGNVYNTVLGRTQVPADNQLLSDLQNTIDGVKLRTSADNAGPIQAQADNILNTAANNGGVLSGAQWKSLTAKGGPIDGLTNSPDPGLRFGGSQLRQNLSDALKRYATPEDQAALQQADQQWKVAKTIEPLAAKAGPTGNISPALLMQPARVSYKNFAGGRGQDMQDLANIGQLLKSPANSETAARASALAGLRHVGEIGAGLGGGLGMVTGHGAEAGAMAGAGAGAGGLLANALMQRAARSPYFTTRLINAGLNGGPRLPGVDGNLLAQALLAQAGLAPGRGQMTTSQTPPQ